MGNSYLGELAGYLKASFRINVLGYQHALRMVRSLRIPTPKRVGEAVMADPRFIDIIKSM